MNYIICFVALIIAVMLLTNESENWKDFEDFLDLKSYSPLIEYPPDTPSPADVYNNQPYHLLSDEFLQPRSTESISCVNSRSCYATDFEPTISRTGNFRQLTNNYKRGYPDSCTGPIQELTLNFYKADPLKPF